MKRELNCRVGCLLDTGVRKLAQARTSISYLRRVVASE